MSAFKLGSYSSNNSAIYFLNSTSVIHTADFKNLYKIVRVCTKRILIMRSVHWEYF
jgi:hypothetical protein